MPRFALTAALVASLLVAACGTTTAPPSLKPSWSPDPTATPSEPAASATPTPSVEASSPPPTDGTSRPPSEVPSDAPGGAPTAAERTLLDGVRRAGLDCAPVRDALPAEAVAGIECTSDDRAIARVGFYRFADESALLRAYLARMTTEGVALDSGGACFYGEGEGSYVPYEGVSPWRDGCFLNDEGFANYRATLPGANVYIGILGRAGDMAALAAYAWAGNQDTPGSPTLWAEPPG